jgi:alkylation response protein AidB-like acyl-CoA dehydrogenase
MDFTFTDEQRMMASAFRELLDDVCSPASIRASFEGRSDESHARWSRIVEMGLPGTLAPEAAGGLGLHDIDFVLIAEEAGRAALPEPVVEHAGVAVPLLTDLAGVSTAAAALLARAASGECRVAVVHPRNTFVLDADRASHLVVCADDEIHLVECDARFLVREPSIDALRRLFSVDASLSAGTRMASGASALAAAGRALERGAVYAAAQCLGLTERMVAIAVEYAKTRSQFGHPIGSYQAIKHHLATVQVKLEFARPVVCAAVTRVRDLDARALAAVSHAKLAAADAAELAARTAMQVHGAMGYSWEVDLHFYMKRAWALAGAWGDRNFHARRLQGLLFEDRVAIGPDRTFERNTENTTP